MISSKDIGSVEKSICEGFFNGTFKVTPRLPAVIFGIETVVRSLFVPGTGFQGLFQQSHIASFERREPKLNHLNNVLEGILWFPVNPNSTLMTLGILLD
jgi:hypothetical protein